MLQPNRKSFPEYIKKGYEYASGKTLDNEKILDLLNKISSIDDSILMLDDILDESETRDGKPCHYKKIGIKNTIIKAELLKTNTFSLLFELMDILETSQINKLAILGLLNDFLTCIYTGEKIDSELSKEKNITKNTLIKYFKMVSLFTGGHFKYWLKIGELLANKKNDKSITKLAVSLGIVRQICDDFEDYFFSHHEPFGDFKKERNRLPEILFKKWGGDRNDVIVLLNSNEISQARDLVLNKRVRKDLFDYCKKEEKIIKSIKTKFDYSDMIEDFSKILTKIHSNSEKNFWPNNNSF